MQFNLLIIEEDVEMIKNAYEEFQKAKQATQEAQYRDALENAYEILTPFIESLRHEIRRREKRETV